MSDSIKCVASDDRKKLCADCLDGKDADVKLRVGSYTYSVSKEKVAVGSKYLKRLFLEKPKDTKFTLPKMDSKAAHAVWKYLSTGELQDDTKLDVDLFEAAMSLEIDELKSKCIKALCENRAVLHRKSLYDVPGNETAYTLSCSSDIAHNFQDLSNESICLEKAGVLFFKDSGLIQEVLKAKSLLSSNSPFRYRKARNAVFPLSKLDKLEFFVNRAGIKLDNLDYVMNCQISKSNEDTISNSQKFLFADLCSAPGGFSDYILWRKNNNANGFVFTLEESECKFDPNKLQKGDGSLLDFYYGERGDGDITNLENLISLEQHVKKRTNNKGVDLVMSDGAFKVKNYENEEIEHHKLYLSQCIAGLSLCKVSEDGAPGGTFVCKFFGIATSFTAGLIYMMYRAFKKITLHKPLMSRTDNSERYLVCENLQLGSANEIKQHLIECHKMINDDHRPFICPVSKIESDSKFCNYYKQHVRGAYECQLEALVRVYERYIEKQLNSKNQKSKDKDGQLKKDRKFKN